MATPKLLASPTLSACSNTSSFIMLSTQTSSNSTGHFDENSDPSDDDEIIYTVSESDSFLSTAEFPYDDAASDDGFVVLSPPKSQPSILETEAPTPEEKENRASTPGIADLTKGLANIGVRNAAPVHGKRKAKAPKAVAVPGLEKQKKKKKKKKSKKSKKGPLPAGKVPAAKPSLTPSSISPGRSQPSSPSSSVSSDKQIEGQSKRSKKGGYPSLGGRSIVDDVSDKFSDYGEGDVGSPTKYEEASSFISLFLSNPDARSNSACRLTLLQALIIELGLASSSLPTSLTAAKAYLKSRAFLNIREYLAVRDQGLAAVQRIMHPSRSSLIKDIRKKQNKAPLKWVKDSGLQVLLVQCYH